MKNGIIYTGQGSDRDIQISAMKALIDAANKAYVEENYRMPQIQPSVEEAQHLQDTIEKRFAGKTRLNPDTYIIVPPKQVTVYNIPNRGKEL